MAAARTVRSLSCCGLCPTARAAAYAAAAAHAIARAGTHALEGVLLTEVITSRKNPLIAQLKKLGTSRSCRAESGLYVCEGDKLYAEALKWQANIDTVLFCGEEPELPPSTRAVRTSKEVLESISVMDSAPDILFSCRIPDCCSRIPAGRHIVLENLQDPGNVGTILRTANAFRIDTVILTGETADPYGPKAVRASMGAIFRQRIAVLQPDELAAALGAAGIPLFAAGFGEDSTDLRELTLPESAAVAIGNEGHGLSKTLLDASEKIITIPMSEACESLNAAAAAAVIMWEFYRRR